MTAVATERWSDRLGHQVIDGNYTKQRGWDVVGYSNEDDAVAATGVVPGQAHPNTDKLYCTDISVVENKFSKAHVVAHYQVTPLIGQNVDPLLRDPVISWRFGKSSQPVDTDMFGNPYLNAAGDVFRSKHNRNFSVRFLRITQYEAFHDAETAANYVDTTNQDSVTANGVPFNPGQMYCLSIAPTSEYMETSAYVPIAYDFEIRTPNGANLTDLQIRYPFQNRVLNQGSRAVYTDSDGTQKLGLLYDSTGNPVQHDVLLNSDGTPNDPGIKVSAAMLDPVAQSLPLNIQVDTIDVSLGSRTVTATYLIFLDYPEFIFSALGVFG